MKKISKYKKNTLSKHLALIGFLGTNALTFGAPTMTITNGGSWSGPVSVNATNTFTGFDGATNGVVAIYNPTGTKSGTYLGLGNSSQIKATGTQSAYGIVLRSDAAKLVVSSELNVEVQGGIGAADTSAGIYLSGAGIAANLGLDSKITVEGAQALGVFVTEGSSLTAEKITVTTTGRGPAVGSIDTFGDQGSSINLGSGSIINANSGVDGGGATGVGIMNFMTATPSTFDATNLTVNTTGNVSTAIQTSSNTITNLGSNSRITTDGRSSDGIFTAGEFTTIDSLSVTTKGTESIAVIVASGGTATIGEGSTIIAEKSGALQATGFDSTAFDPDIGGTLNFKGSATKRNTVTSGGAFAVSADAGGAVNLEYTDANVTAANASALWATGSFSGASSTINALDTNITGASGSVGALSENSGIIKLTGDTNITMATPADVAIKATGVNSTVSSAGKMNVIGSIMASDKGVSDLTMTSGSLLTGKTDTSSNTGTVNLSLAESNWNMTADSQLTNLALNNSTVEFTENKVGSTLTTGNLSGSGTFKMQVNMADTVGDKLLVTGSSAGNHHITAQNNGAANTTGNELLTIVETTDGIASFDLTNKVEVGGYVYDLRKKDNNTDWELFSIPKGRSGGGEISNTANAAASFLNAGYLLNYAETQTLLQRMGELHQTENSQGDAWVRAYTGKFDSFDSGKLSSFDMDYTGVQVGADKRLVVNGANLYLGAMIGTSQADPKFVSGDGDLKSYNLGVYGTYVTEDNFYVDGVVKYTHMKNKFNNVVDTQGFISSGNAATDGYSVSLEAGKRFYLNETKSGYYIEPQAQLSYTHQGSTSTTASNGLVTSIDSYDSTIGRISALVGYEIKDGANPVNVYFKTGYVTELSGGMNYALNGNKESNDFGGGWWDNGIGVTTQINKQHNLYVEGTYSTGSKFDQIQLNAGYRYSF